MNFKLWVLRSTLTLKTTDTTLVSVDGNIGHSIAKLESRGSRGFREISDFELELASASL